MKIIDRLREDGIHISFEIFPPKTDAGYDKVIRAAEEMAGLKPEFISVTYGAGGGTSKNTAKIASYIKHDLHVESLAHLTCASSTKDEVRSVIASLKEQGIENILALRGDISEDMVFPSEDRFHYAYQLVEEIRRHGDFCIGAACYPEGHVENEHKEDDIKYLKQKVDSGVDFLTTPIRALTVFPNTASLTGFIPAKSTIDGTTMISLSPTTVSKYRYPLAIVEQIIFGNPIGSSRSAAEHITVFCSPPIPITP